MRHHIASFLLLTQYRIIPPPHRGPFVGNLLGQTPDGYTAVDGA